MTTLNVGDKVKVSAPSATPRGFLLGLTGTVKAVLDGGTGVVQMDQDVTAHYVGSMGFPNSITLDPGECELST